MKTKKLSREVREKAVNKLKGGFGTKCTISQAFENSVSNPLSENRKSIAQLQPTKEMAVNLKWKAGQAEH